MTLPAIDHLVRAPWQNGEMANHPKVGFSCKQIMAAASKEAPTERRQHPSIKWEKHDPKR